MLGPHHQVCVLSLRALRLHQLHLWAQASQTIALTNYERH